MSTCCPSLSHSVYIHHNIHILSFPFRLILFLHPYTTLNHKDSSWTLDRLSYLPTYLLILIMRPPAFHSRPKLSLLAILSLALAAALVAVVPVLAEEFEDSGLYQDQVPPPMPPSPPTATSVISAFPTSTPSLPMIPDSGTGAGTDTQVIPQPEPTAALPDSPSQPTNSGSMPAPTQDAYEYTPPAKGKGKPTTTGDCNKSQPAPPPPPPPAVIVTIDNDYGINSHEPHVSFTPHIDPKVETPMSRFHPAFGAAIPPRPKCKPRKPAGKSPLEARPETASVHIKGGYEKRQAPAPAPPRVPKNDFERVEFYFGQRLVTNLASLPAESHFSPVPWAASYWPTFRDSINARWAPNELPPSDKYARAFGLNVAQFRDSVSRHNGILAQSHRRPCATNQDCRTLNDGSVCAKREGEIRGFCIPTWFGICHAWAPAAVMEPEPRCPVTKNGVTFRPFDIKALVTLLWDGARTPTVFTGNRYNGPENAAKDEFGRFTDPTYRDLNPGFMHILMANMLGRFRKSFVVDVTGSAEVWNQPVKGYKVLEQSLMTPAAAAQRFFNTPTYRFNTRAAMIASVKTRFTWVVEAGEDGPLVSTGRINEYLDSRDYTYLLELDARQNIIGGEWVGASRADHPDFAWFPAQRPAMDVVTRVGLTYRHVRELLDESVRAQC
ncbi:hypothetical protein BCR44DRAFT_1482578 [Catenaria anguillulae PL171]|uniref:Uncharacterized protein n=1 Tax=Catenaria anguillulae PL171 TaxID=765915 RepID=A0A1Y2HZJ5_9FUNG|nr:hypothetical protein BCR44DRAFT_1482578 [Catenaria anguillulae PL171]